MKVLVKSDVYNICNRVKKFDPSYRVVYNNVPNRYEIYSTHLQSDIELISGVPLSYVCAVPYNELDVRTINHLHNTRVENIHEIVEAIDKQNQKLEYDNLQNLKNQSLLIAEDKLRQLT